MDRIYTFLERQRDFERLVDFPIDSILEQDRNEMSEKFVFKLIEEAVELRKEFPSVANPWSKSQKSADLQRVKEEFSDILMFLIDILLVWKFTPDEILSTLETTQLRNFNTVKKKKMDFLNSDILKIPSRVSGIGQGNLSPKYVFIGQNPGTDIAHGYKFWSNKEEGSTEILLSILSDLGILDDCYFTDAVKCATPNNEEPNRELTEFYLEFLTKEIEILAAGNPYMKVIAIGNWTGRILEKYGVYTVQHPVSVIHGTITKSEYEHQIKTATSYHS